MQTNSRMMSATMKLAWASIALVGIAYGASVISELRDGRSEDSTSSG
jgi:hypothetical protein